MVIFFQRIAIPSTVEIQDAELLALEEELKALDAEAIGSTFRRKKKGFFPKLMAIFGKLESWLLFFCGFLWANFWDSKFELNGKNVGRPCRIYLFK